ncbi:Hsp20/alpha crystallin family protein [Schlesneria paludicola]|uniref:Hsp20/alpha crystallin family protein n=1 Tax=Schlesneria paludicola TaxID=360056 RepID=UPI00029A385F|nr:Hsp20/alpha crystallin family protein [Schlesneria paludicola]
MTTAVTKKAEGTETKEGLALARDPWQSFGFPSLNRMRREFDEMLSRFFTDVPALWNAERGDGRWAFDVEDHPDAYLIKAEAPGFELKDFKVDVRGNQLVMQAKRSEKKKEKDKESFSATEYYHAMMIPPFVDTHKISANYKHGVLQLSLPKTEEGKGRNIPVNG